ncbi:MAG: hypothetical protein COX44_02565 [Candidatus Portnoybacteria bacterium CG23_combo_of_CG06-09_8_20_14_all_37_13]|uniref:Solute-binding protein family 5 domain-containing protein n=1 Tax=Candidatus Portnoybacteria bacterium CG23_combo_of_CG06-09_8_20_14_all_37_13 TaxID=1974819 RepID=A0A2G9YCI8_9BACT|nr:MAG: hypothetical protein COX44_02565 [Candidatus Portnoybacteria bacterium CG23_combo_of_CG06-09_8_20_14_all_37_13]
MQCFYKVINSLNKKERSLVLGLLGLIIVCLISILIKPEQIYIEGIIGSPRYINPVLAQNNDVDLDLTELIFGSLIFDLTENYQISDNQKEYTLILKKDLKWHDNKPVTADDVLFTIQTIQDPVYQSPLRINFQGIGIEKIDEQTFKFILKDVYAPFLTSLDIGILPKHVWQEIAPQSFALAETNIKPIGNGPFKFKNLKKSKNGEIKSVDLESFDDRVSIKNIIFKFYPNEQELINAFLSRQIDGLSYVSPKNLEKLNNINIYKLIIPRYFAVFFNMDKIKDLKARQSLAAVVDKQKIIDQILLGQGYKAGPEYDFQKDNIDLSFNLITTNWPELVQTAEILKQEWQEIGAKVEVKIAESNSMQQDYIRPRNYDALLFGEVLSPDPDPFAFWHSSQKKDPGLNLSLYDNPKADKLLVEARQTLDQEKRQELYEQFKDLLKKDLPAIFLYNPVYLYGVSKKVHGIELNEVALPSKRFENIEKWYIK